MKIILFLILFTLVLSLQLYSNLNLEKIQEEIEKSNLEVDLIKEEHIENNPNSAQSVLYLFQTNESERAKSLLKKLIASNEHEAIYANALLSLEGKYLPTNKETALNTLKEQCSTYIEPCVFLGSYFRKIKDHKSAIKYLKKALDTNEITIFDGSYHCNASNAGIKMPLKSQP